jgi:hypothetical protein
MKKKWCFAMGMFLFQIFLIAVLFFIFFSFLDFFTLIFPNNLFLIVFFSYISLIITLIILPAVIHRVFRFLLPKEGSSTTLSKKETFFWGINMTLLDTSYWLVSKLLPHGLFPHVIYKFFGLTYGKGVAIFPRLWDVEMLEIGDYTIIGTDVITGTHMMIADGRLYRKKIRIGHHCTIATNSVILPGATIGDYCIVAPNSVVPMNSKLDSYSIYSGNPVEKVKDLRDRYGITSTDEEITEQKQAKANSKNTIIQD